MLLTLSPFLTALHHRHHHAQQVVGRGHQPTTKFYNAVAAMDAPGRDYLATIKAYAETTDNPNVYVLAQIPPPAPPTPVPAPATPTNLTASIDASGILSLSWEAERSGPSTGIIFLVSRQDAEGAPFTLTGATFAKSFIDPTFVACNGQISYRVQAQRGDLFSGFAGPLQINLGGPGLTLTAAPAVGGEAKMAA